LEIRKRIINDLRLPDNFILSHKPLVADSF
jgi:hypothetical protein